MNHQRIAKMRVQRRTIIKTTTTTNRIIKKSKVIKNPKCNNSKYTQFSQTQTVPLKKSTEFYRNIIKELRKNTNKVKICKDEMDIVRKCLLCRFYLSSMQWGPLLEKYIKDRFKIGKPLNSTSGDGCSPRKKNIEIKVSLGTSQGTFNFVQIRPDHNIHYYLFLAYDVYFGKEGKIYWFLCNAQALYKLIPQFGGYAHGTVAKFGKITLRNMKGRNMEYALRPSPSSRHGSNPYKLWQIMIKKFIVSENVIRKTI